MMYRIFIISMVVLLCISGFSTAQDTVASSHVAAITGKQEAVSALKNHGVEEIIFTVRGIHGDGHWYANIGYHEAGPHQAAYNNKVPSKLVRCNLQTGKEIILLEDKTGGIRDPQVHYDAEKILFSYRKGGEAQYHLFEIDIDGSNLHQLTDGIYDDIEPSYLPGGGIVFVSTRAQRWVNCWNTQVGTIYRCDNDGNNIRALSVNIEHDNTPWVMPDGRIIYTRWEYVDRSRIRFHHLWTMNPDGSNQKVLFGNMHPGSLFIDAKPIPGSKNIVLSVSPGHGRKEHMGHLSLLSLNNGPDDKNSINKISKVLVKDPCALSEDLFLAVSCDGSAISVIDGKGKAFPLRSKSNHPERWENLHEPRPLIARKRERIIPSRVDLAKSTGTLVLQNANIGRNMEGVKQGDITKLLILETLPKPINHWNGDYLPISWGGTFTLERILGTIPVEPDGSAHFEVPANRPLVLVALDKEGKTVKRMQSFLSVAPGEILSCIGCHEDRVKTPANNNAVKLQAMQRQASPITMVPNIPSVIDYARDIQPIWDKHCVSCHNPNKLEGDADLSSDYGIIYFMSYMDLFLHGQISDGRDANGNTAPRKLGDVNSPLMEKLNGSHHNVTLSSPEIEMIRHWIHIGAPHTGTYGAIGTGILKGRHNSRGSAPLNKELERTFSSVKDVLDRRCSNCHGNKNHPAGRLKSILGGGRGLVRGPFYDRLNVNRLYNLKHPKKSRILTSSLPVSAGGRDIRGYDMKTKTFSDKVPHKIFESTDDPDYQILLKAIERAKHYLETKNPRWHMKNFKPTDAYIREMIRYGILPETFNPASDPINVYKTDEAYWKTQQYHTQGTSPNSHDNPKARQYFKKDHKGREKSKVWELNK